jgi:DNA repair protein RadC
VKQIIEQMPEFERPRERCLQSGADCLSLRECLALILGSGPAGLGCLGVARQILQVPGEGLSFQDEEKAFFTGIEVAGTNYLKRVPGLGPAGQAKILAAFEVGRRYTLYRYRQRKLILKRPSYSDLTLTALSRVSMENRASPQEWFGFVPVHRSGEVGELCVVEKGARTHVNVDPAELFARILALRPHGVFLFHNHPTGFLIPSPQDFDITKRVDDIGIQFGIQLLGHWIVSLQGEKLIKESQDTGD